MFNEGYISKDTFPIIGLIIGEVSIKMWLYFVSVSMSVSSSYDSTSTEAVSGRHSSGVLSRSEKACTVWEPKLGFGKKIYNQCFVIIFGYYLVNCEVYMW